MFVVQDYARFAVGDRIYVGLTKQGDIWDVQFASHSPPDGLYIKGRVTRTWQRGLDVEYGIESYFVPEGSGHIIERARDVKVRVAVDSSGNAVIKGLLVDGKPFRADMAAKTEVPSGPPTPAATPATTPATS